MDITSLIFGKQEWNWREECMISAIFGAVMVLVSYFFDRRTKLDYAFWGYFFGAICFWCGLSFMDSNSELNKFIYCLINLGLIVVSVFLQRKIFLVLGALGVCGYLGHLAYTVFKDSIAFPFVLSVMGILIIYLGIKYQKNHDRVDAWLRGIFGRQVTP